LPGDSAAAAYSGPVTVAERRRKVDRLVERCYAGLHVAELQAETLRRLRGLMGIDAAFFATVDPATILFTSVVSEAPLDQLTPLFLDNEFGHDDVNKFAELAAGSDHVRSLDQATDGDRRTSDRYVDVMEPVQLGDELRAALVSGQRCWGVLCLHRTESSSGFSDAEVKLVRRLAPHLAEGLRRALVLDGIATARSGTRGPGIIVLDDDMAVTSMNAEAERWMAELVDPAWIDLGHGSLPAAVFAAATAMARADDAGRGTAPAVRLRATDGRWLTLHASRLSGATGDGQTAVVVEAARGADVASIYLDALGLTPAQTRVASLVLQGRSTQQIINELRISSHTVQEHLRAVFDKLGVASRRELVATLLGDHR
jgi:DNA-binding CsgD family transcriptional regulator